MNPDIEEGMGRKEAKTRRNLIDPKLKASGWEEHDWQVEPEYAITAGRIHWDGKSAKRSRPVYADYLLRCRPAVAIAIVEAKDEDLHHLEGATQAKSYAQKLGLWFAYATNGHQIEFFDLKKGTQETVERFHSPAELWDLYLLHTGVRPTPPAVQAITQDFYSEAQIGQRRKPRYYQEKAVRSAVEAILRGQKRVLITQATGTGKTFTSMQLVYKLFKARAAKKILFIVDRNLLADQAFIDFNNAMDKDSCYRITPKDKQFPLGRDIYFGIYQSLVGEDDDGSQVGRPDRYKEFPADYFDLIVIDEAHRGGANQAGSWFKLLDYFKLAVQVGLTATPKRDDTNDTYKYFGAPVVNYSLKDGIEDGFLSPYIIKRVTSNIDALGYRPEHSDVRDVRGRVIPNQDYFTADFERRLSIPERTRAFAYHLLRHLFTTDPLGKTIAFCVDQAHALDMAKYVNEGFSRYKQKHNLEYNGSYAVRISGNDKETGTGKYPMLEKFADLESNEPIVVTTSKLLTTGIDVKTVKNVVIFRNIGSMVEFKQVIGRGTRIYDHKDKHREKLGFFILEYANFSTQLFHDPEWDDDPTDIIDEPSVDVPESVRDTDEGADAVSQTPDILDSGSEQLEGLHFDPEVEAELRFRMSEEFLRGNVKMAAESVAFTGPNGKPLTPEKFIVYQSEALQKRFSQLADFQKAWSDSRTRKEFMEEGATELGVSIDALTSIFFDKHKQREVDAYDVIANLVFGQRYLTKVERIAKAEEQNQSFFAAIPGKAKALVDDLLSVYCEMDFKPFAMSSELLQVPRVRRHGSIKQLQELVGGQEMLVALVTGLQNALYDPRIAA